MIILGIDTSTDRLGIGLADLGGVIFEERLDSAQEHASQIIGLIDRVLSHMSQSVNDLHGIAVSDGPGSFTGLRIGMAAAKGMVLALDIPIVGVSTFEVMARRLALEYNSFYLAAMARTGEYYLCRVDAGVNVRKSIVLVEEVELPARVGSLPVGLIGRNPDGWSRLIPYHIPVEKTIISAGELAIRGAERIAAGDVDDPASLEPLYIAPAQAERKFQRPDFIIRRMTEADLPEVVRNEKELFSDPWPEAIFREDLASSYSYPFVLQIDNDIAGYAVLWVGVEEGHLTNIAVAKKYQRKSVAKKLLSYILKLASSMGLAQIILEVRPSNTPAISLYECFGFERLAIRNNYYRYPVEDCLVMRKEITGGDPA